MDKSLDGYTYWDQLYTTAEAILAATSKEKDKQDAAGIIEAARKLALLVMKRVKA